MSFWLRGSFSVGPLNAANRFVFLQHAVNLRHVLQRGSVERCGKLGGAESGDPQQAVDSTADSLKPRFYVIGWLTFTHDMCKWGQRALAAGSGAEQELRSLNQTLLLEQIQARHRLLRGCSAKKQPDKAVFAVVMRPDQLNSETRCRSCKAKGRQPEQSLPTLACGPMHQAIGCHSPTSVGCCCRLMMACMFVPV